MATPEAQNLVDASERDAADRYLRRQKFAWLVKEATDRAAAFERLDYALRNYSAGSVQTGLRHGRGLIERDGLA